MMRFKISYKCVFSTNFFRFSRFSQNFSSKKILPQTTPNVFQGFGKKIEPEENKNSKFFLSKKNTDSTNDIQKKIKEIENTLKKEKNNKLSPKNIIINLLELCQNQILLNKEERRSFVNLKNINKILKENNEILSFSIQNFPKINKIIISLVDLITLCEYFENPKKIALLNIFQEFLEIIFKNLETEVYKTIHNKNERFFISEINEYQNFMANRSTFSFFVEMDIFPKNFENFLDFLQKEKKNTKNPNLEKSINDFYERLGFYFNENSQDFSNFSNFTLQIFQEKIKELNSLSGFNEILLFSEGVPQNFQNSLFLMINEELVKNFQKFLEKSSLQTIFFFTLIVSRKNSIISKNKLISFQILQLILKKIKTFSQFLAIFSCFLEPSFINIDELLKEFHKYSLDFKYTLNSQEILQFAKLTQIFYLFSHENEYVFSILASLDEILRKTAVKFTMEEKFFLVSYLESLDIPSKINLNSEIVQNLNLCPKNLLSKIIVHICDFSYNLIDFKDLEKIVTENLQNFSIFQKLNIFKGFIYHLEGSEGFVAEFLEKCYQELNFNDPQKFVKNPISSLCIFYQIIFTIKGFYKPKFSILSDFNLKSWFSGFQSKYDEYDNPFYPQNSSFSKEEFELEVYLKDLNIKFDKQKRILLHKVDFFIEDRLCLEVQGRHHYAGKFLFDGKTKWKMRNIKEKSGFEYFSISVEKWKTATHQQKINLIKEIVQKK